MSNFIKDNDSDCHLAIQGSMCVCKIIRKIDIMIASKVRVHV